MGLQSSRIYYNTKDHKDICYNGHYHKAMYIGNQLVWEKKNNIYESDIDVSAYYMYEGGNTNPNHLWLKGDTQSQYKNYGMVFTFDGSSISGRRVDRDSIGYDILTGGRWYYHTAYDSTAKKTVVRYTSDNENYNEIDYTFNRVESNGVSDYTKTYTFGCLTNNYAWYYESKESYVSKNLLRLGLSSGGITTYDMRDPSVSSNTLAIYNSTPFQDSDRIICEINGELRIVDSGMVLPNNIRDWYRNSDAYYFCDDDYIWRMVRDSSDYSQIEISNLNKVATHERTVNINLGEYQASTGFRIANNHLILQVSNYIDRLLCVNLADYSKKEIIIPSGYRLHIRGGSRVIYMYEYDNSWYLSLYKDNGKFCLMKVEV